VRELLDSFSLSPQLRLIIYWYFAPLLLRQLFRTLEPAP
jgi:hypothetical protein